MDGSFSSCMLFFTLPLPPAFKHTRWLDLKVLTLVGASYIHMGRVDAWL
jgi:hypothetical protein